VQPKAIADAKRFRDVWRVFMQRTTKRIVLAGLLAALLVTASGCWPFDLASNATSFAAGWLVRGFATQTPTTELTCYRNGVAIDCADVPAEMLPANP
jgi:hypothetical protein